MMTDKELYEWARKGAVDMVPCCICGREYNMKRGGEINRLSYNLEFYDICHECWDTNFSPVIKEKLRELLRAKTDQKLL